MDCRNGDTKQWSFCQLGSTGAYCYCTCQAVASRMVYIESGFQWVHALNDYGQELSFMVSHSYLFLPFSPKTVTLKLDSNPGLVHQRDPLSSRFPWTLRPKRWRLRNIFPITIDTIKFFLPGSKSICSSFTFMFDEQTQVAIRPASRCFNDGHLDFCLGCIWHRVKSSDCLFRWSLARLRNEWTDGLSSSLSHSLAGDLNDGDTWSEL